MTIDKYSGIYRLIRHPAYTGNIITSAGIPLTLGSLWAFIPSGIAIFLVILRTYLEDNTLQKGISRLQGICRKNPLQSDTLDLLI